MNDYSFGNFVCELREQKGLTQAEVAKKLGVTAAAVSKWENGSAKPRVELLFGLAELLGVTTKELMAGRRLEDLPDADSVRQINERYEYLRKIDLHNTSKAKLFRLIAALIDWNVIGIATLAVISALLSAFSFFRSSGTTQADPSQSAISMLTLILPILAYPVCFVMRDLLLGGRSLGKRIMGLTVISKITGEAPKKSELVLRNIFVPIVQIEAIIMLATGLSLGDRVAHTVVVLKKDLDRIHAEAPASNGVEQINSYAAIQKAKALSNKKMRVIWIILIAVAGALFIGILLTMISAQMNETKNTEEYKLAYHYLINSEAFEKADIPTDKVKFSSYSWRASASKDGTTRADATVTFQLGFWQKISVTLHDDGDGWYVCEDCTEFH